MLVERQKRLYLKLSNNDSATMQLTFTLRDVGEKFIIADLLRNKENLKVDMDIDIYGNLTIILET